MGLLTVILSKFKKAFRYILNRDGHIMAPPLTWKTSRTGSNFNYLKNSIKDLIKPNPAGKKFSEIMVNNPTREQVQLACDIFEKETGVKMLMTHPGGAFSFNTNANILIRNIKNGDFPKDVRYVVIGHGDGTVLNDTWHVLYEPNTPVFDFIEKNIPKGELAIVNCCECTPKEISYLIPKNKPAIGRVAGEFTSSYRHPAKVVRSGEREIIGGYANGIMTLYK